MDIVELFDYEGEKGCSEINNLLAEALLLFDNFAEDVELFREYEGHIIAPNFSIPSIEFAFTEWVPRKGDVVVASFPKTGTTWTLEIIRRLLHKNEEVFRLFKQLPMSMQILEAGDPQKFYVLDKISPKYPRIFFTHLSAPLINVDLMEKVGVKIVYVLRNPKDQMVSWYSFYQKLPKYSKEPLKTMIFSGWEKFFDNYVQGKFPTHSKPGEWYPDHILSWLKHRNRPCFKFVYYEDLQQDLFAEIEALASFLDVKISEGESKTIAEKCSLKSMTSQTRGTKGMAKTHAMIFRSGKVGGWRNYFSEKQTETVDEIFETKLKNSNIKFLDTL